MTTILKLFIFVFFLSGCATTYTEKEVIYISQMAYNDGFEKAKNICLDEVVDNIYSIGLRKGYNLGYDEGYEFGKSVGRSIGKIHAISECFE